MILGPGPPVALKLENSHETKFLKHDFPVTVNAAELALFKINSQRAMHD